jgi:CHAD domain-containing protein
MSPAERHLVRIEAKKLRYGCEFFASLHPDTPHGVTASGESLPRPLAFGRQAEQVQTALGLVNDHATAEHLLVGVGSHAPSVDEHRLVGEAVEAVRALATLDPFWR